MVHPAKPQSFEDREYFPSFRNCPSEHTWDDRYLVDAAPGSPDSTATNKKHWCLLGEIVQAENFIRPRLVAKDYEGREFVVAFYPDDPDDMPRLLQNFNVGNTVAIFYPLVHRFLDGTAGVRVEDSDEVIIIPLELSEVFAMNKEAIKYTPTDGTPQKCYSCDEAKKNLLKCGRCESAHYCSKECQTVGWNDKKHKRFCKALKDEGVKQMHSLDYGVFKYDIGFS
ncbi:hypothetical protein F4781DRAFT_402523 [Annulohypoxylon bovei var. microspora]|nr:hypothetical protein F4781DRAFT_402523 [Annulohypoxylon bovei var. microspora]